MKRLQLVVLLTLAGMKKSFGVDEILRNVTFKIDRHEKVALVGRNGTGKTTLLKIINGLLDPDGGSVQIAKGAKIGYLTQESPVNTDKTVLEEAESARAAVLQIEARLEELRALLEHSPSAEDLEEFATLQDHFIELEGYSTQRDLRTVLQKVGFTPDEFDKPASKLSGGEKTRLALARLLLESPDLLILDEPTNHLDIQATLWLESWLRSYPGAVLLVSHDRTFLENVGDRVLELREGTVKSYPGPFVKYIQLRAEENARQEVVAKRQQLEMAKMDEYVRRFMNSERTSQARGRLKMLEKLKATAVVAPTNDKGMKGGFHVQKRSGDTVLECKNLTMGFGSSVLFKDVCWTVRIGERWGVIGDNGSGKSTLIKCALGKLNPLGGDVKLGSNVVLGYFSQDTVELDPKVSPIDYLVYEFDLLPADARKLLARFLLTGDDVFRPIRTLSGGEKNKLVLASLTILNPNLLILDEPTNHLDMDSREALASVLKEFKGTLILISHDRWLLQQVTTHTFDLKKDGPVLFMGGLEDYVRRSTLPKTEAASVTVVEKRTALSHRELSKEIQRLTKSLSELEVEVAQAEADLVANEAALSTPSLADDVVALSQKHGQLRQVIDKALSAWLSTTEALEQLKAQQG